MAERIAFRGNDTDRAHSGLAKDRLPKADKLKGAQEHKEQLRYCTGSCSQKIEKYRKKNGNKPIRTHVREAVILPAWVGMKFEVHNGKEFKKITITANMLGHRLGEFAYTTKRVQHSAPGIRATRGSKFLAVK